MFYYYFFFKWNKIKIKKCIYYFIVGNFIVFFINYRIIWMEMGNVVLKYEIFF